MAAEPWGGLVGVKRNRIPVNHLEIWDVRLGDLPRKLHVSNCVESNH